MLKLASSEERTVFIEHTFHSCSISVLSFLMPLYGPDYGSLSVKPRITACWTCIGKRSDSKNHLLGFNIVLYTIACRLFPHLSHKPSGQVRTWTNAPVYLPPANYFRKGFTHIFLESYYRGFIQVYNCEFVCRKYWLAEQQHEQHHGNRANLRTSCPHCTYGWLGPIGLIWKKCFII